MIFGGAPLLLKTQNLAYSEQPLDATTLSEVDPNVRLSYSGTRVTATNLERGVVAYAYKDSGAADIGDITVDFDFRNTAFVAGSSAGVCGFRVALGAWTAESGWSGVFVQESGGSMQLAAIVRGQGLGANIAITNNVTYYCRLTRDYATGELILYVATSSANRDTETWAGTSTYTPASATPSYQYFVPVQGFDPSGANVGSFYIEEMFVTGEKA